MTHADTPEHPGTKTETKTKAATLAAFVAGLAIHTFLSTTATDYIRELPDFWEVIGLPLLQAGIVLAAGYTTRHRPGQMSASAEAALRRTIERRMSRL
jgi:hypothetical protein